jgi:hypothetical protein
MVSDSESDAPLQLVCRGRGRDPDRTAAVAHMWCGLGELLACSHLSRRRESDSRRASSSYSWSCMHDGSGAAACVVHSDLLSSGPILLDDVLHGFFCVRFLMPITVSEHRFTLLAT